MLLFNLNFNLDFSGLEWALLNMGAGIFGALGAFIFMLVGLISKNNRPRPASQNGGLQIMMGFLLIGVPAGMSLLVYPGYQLTSHIRKSLDAISPIWLAFLLVSGILFMALRVIRAKRLQREAAEKAEIF